MCKVVTESAFTQARYKIKWTFFRQLAQQLYPLYFQSDRLLWKGHTLIGVDGSTFNLRNTKNLENEFGIFAHPGKTNKRILAKTLLVYDSLNHYVFDGIIRTKNDSEIGMFYELLPTLKYPKNSVFIFDRGFSGRNVIENFLINKITFCVRIRCDTNFCVDFLNLNIDDWTGKWEPTSDQKRKYKGTSPFKVRLVRRKLKSGEWAVYATNLFDTSAYSSVDIQQLYRCRWGVEEGFKKLKAFMKVEQFGSGKPEGIRQEYYSHLLHINILSILGVDIQKQVEKNTSHRKIAYQYNWKIAHKLLRMHFIELILNYKRRDRLLENLIEQMSVFITAIKPDRHFPRSETMKGRKPRISAFYK